MAVTVTLSVASANNPPLSVTRSVKAAVVAVQLATTEAVTWPDELTLRPETVTPFTVALAAPLTVTVSELSASSASLTAAICALAAGLPAVRVKAVPAIAGGVLTVPLWAKYRPPVLKLPLESSPPQTIISLPVQTAV